MLKTNSKNDFVVYTAIFGNRDSLKEPLVTNDRCDYICFTDKNIKSKTYKIIMLDNFFAYNNHDAKIFKILPHIFLSNYKYSVWIDGSILIKNDFVNDFRILLNKNKLLLYKHSSRNCVYDEAEICIKSGLGVKDDILNQISYYKQHSYPLNNGLYENGIVARQNHDLVIVDMDIEWWNQIRRFSWRDQISLPYVLSMFDLTPKILDGTIYDNTYFEVIKHLTELK